MEKKHYYISVQSDSILSDPTISSYELEIEATEEQCEQLRSLFNGKMKHDNGTFIRTPIPGIPYHQDSPNDQYDNHLVAIYRFIHELGTPETKQHIEQMKLEGIGTYEQSHT